MAFQDIATRDVDWEVLDQLLIEELWEVYKISNRLNPPATHESVKSTIRRKLRERGVTLTPDSIPEIRLPPEAVGTKREVINILREYLHASFVPLCVCDSMLANAKVISEEHRALGSALQNHKSWIGKMNAGDKLP